MNSNQNEIVVIGTSTSVTRSNAGRTGRFRSTKRQIPDSIVTSLSSFPHRSPTLSLENIIIVTRQLGYLPVNIIDVLSTLRGKAEPQVAILYPLNCKTSVYDRTGVEFNDSDAKPFPTTFWITCPKLHASVSRLEDNGWITRLQRRLLEEEGFEEHLEAMQLAHRRYAEYRMSLLSSSHRLLIHEKGWTEKLSEVGVAGMRTFDCVKCLHCHYAHYIGRPEDGNVIGKWVQELLEGKEGEEEGEEREEEEGEGEGEGEGDKEEVTAGGVGGVHNVSLVTRL